MATSPGQQSLRDFSKACTALEKYIHLAHKEGEYYTEDNIWLMFEQLLEEYKEYLSENELNVDYWYRRGLQVASQKAFQTNVKEQFEKPEKDDDEGTEETFDPRQELLGYRVISESECIQNGHRVRGQVLLTLPELAEYIEPIPAGVVQGIVIIRNDRGEREGYSICGSTTSR